MKKHGFWMIGIIIYCVLSSAVISAAQNPGFSRIQGKSYATTVIGGETAMLEFDDSILLTLSALNDLDLGIEFNAEFKEKQLFIGIDNTETVELTLSGNSFLTRPPMGPPIEFFDQLPVNPFANNDLSWEQVFDSYFVLEIDNTNAILSLNFSIPASDLGVESMNYENVKWVIYDEQNDDEWKEIDSETNEEYSIAYLDSESIGSEIYLMPVLSESPSSFFQDNIIIIVISVALIIFTVYTMTKLEFFDYLKNRAFQYKGGIHRLSMEDILENEIRSDIINLVLKEPGIHYSEIQRQLDITGGNLVWHLDLLVDYKIIKKERVGHYLCFFPIFMDNPFNEENYDLKLQKSKKTLEILDYIDNNPGKSIKEIGKTTRMERKAVEYHLKKLQENKMVESRKVGRKNVFYSRRE